MNIAKQPGNDHAQAPAGLAQLHDRETKVPHHQLPCRANGPELWFAEVPAELEAAKALCQVCPVQSDCLDGALQRREPWGVWGGRLFLHGAVIPRKPPRGRPPKDRVTA